MITENTPSVKPALTYARLRELLRYDPETGRFRWRRDHGVRARACEIAGTPRYDKRAAERGPFCIAIGIDGKTYTAHRLAWLYVHGEWPPSDIDHRDRDPTNNSLANLRLATRRQNAGNSRKRRTNTSGFKGVTRRRGRTKWDAQIKTKSGTRRLGSYITPEAAHDAYREAAVAVFGEFAHFGA